MAKTDAAGLEPSPGFRDVLLVVIIFALPLLIPQLFGWVQVLGPLPFFYAVLIFGPSRGTILVVKAFLIVAGILLLTDTIQAYLFTATLLPLGFTLASSARSRKTVEYAGLFGLLTLFACYCCFWLFVISTTGENPYLSLQEELGSTARQWTDGYLENIKSVGTAEEEIRQIEYGFQQVSIILPMFLPGFLMITMIFQVWINLGLGSLILRRISPDTAPWRKFCHWRLSDQLVWWLIISGGAIMIPLPTIQLTGVNALIVIGFLYGIQGMAVLSFLLKKWQIPAVLRTLIYLVLIVPGYGLLMLSGIGLAEVWANFRITRKQEKNPL